MAALEEGQNIQEPTGYSAGATLKDKTIDYTHFFGPDAQKTQKLVDYYEGNQINYVIAMLDGGLEGYGKRKDWRNRGIIPRTRNVIKSIVDKSGLLFNKPPKLEIVVGKGLPRIDEPTLQQLLEQADWDELSQNIDVYTRLTGSIIVLVEVLESDNVTTGKGQYSYASKTGEQLLITILHHGNAVCKMNAARTKITELGYILEGISFGHGNRHTSVPTTFDYCVWTPDYQMTVHVNRENTNADKAAEEITGSAVNPYGIVPAHFSYDVRKPRKGHWTRPAEDLISLQEIVNLALTDTEFAVAFEKQKMLFITGDIILDENQGDMVIPAAPPGFTPAGRVYNDIPFYQTRKGTSLGGLGTVAKLSSDGNGAAGKAEFVGPNTNLKQLDDIIDQLIRTVANDWGVNLSIGGSGHANSGFQLIVEEVGNLTLRETRQQSMQATLRRFYEILKQLYPGLTDGYLQAEFAPPSLPVNKVEEEQLWTIKIANGRASIKDYYMVEYGMTEDEAIAKCDEVQQLNAKYNVQPAKAAPAPAAPAAMLTPSQGGPVT